MAERKSSDPYSQSGVSTSLLFGTWRGTFWTAAILAGLCLTIFLAAFLWAMLDPNAPQDERVLGLLLFLAIGVVSGFVVMVVTMFHWKRLTRLERTVAAIIFGLTLCGALFFIPG